LLPAVATGRRPRIHDIGHAANPLAHCQPWLFERRRGQSMTGGPGSPSVTMAEGRLAVGGRRNLSRR
jgi:hypothetical protein